VTGGGGGSGVDSWYVAFRNPKRPGSVYVRTTSTFRTESEAKRFASDRLAEGCDVSAGTLNPHQPKKTVGSSQIMSWLESHQRGFVSDHRMLKKTLHRE
jgi:hypothetical protein